MIFETMTAALTMQASICLSLMKNLTYTDSVYQTVPRKISRFSRTFPEISLYWQFLDIVFAASAKARHGKYKDDLWLASSLGCLRALESVGVRVEVSGINHVKKLAEPCVFIGNHMSLAETIILPAMLRPLRRVTFIVKQGLLTYPVFGPVMRSRDPIAISRTDPRKDLKTVISGGVRRLASGISIIVFPQTSRMVEFQQENFSSIGVKLAQKADVPIIPLALKTDAWGNGKYLKDFGKISPEKPVRFAFGRPFRVGKSGTDAHLRVIRFINEKLCQWQETGTKPVT